MATRPIITGNTVPLKDKILQQLATTFGKGQKAQPSGPGPTTPELAELISQPVVDVNAPITQLGNGVSLNDIFGTYTAIGDASPLGNPIGNNPTHEEIENLLKDAFSEAQQNVFAKPGEDLSAMPHSSYNIRTVIHWSPGDIVRHEDLMQSLAEGSPDIAKLVDPTYDPDGNAIWFSQFMGKLTDFINYFIEKNKGGNWENMLPNIQIQVRCGGALYQITVCINTDSVHAVKRIEGPQFAAFLQKMAEDLKKNQQRDPEEFTREAWENRRNNEDTTE